MLRAHGLQEYSKRFFFKAVTFPSVAALSQAKNPHTTYYIKGIDTFVMFKYSRFASIFSQMNQ